MVIDYLATKLYTKYYNRHKRDNKTIDLWSLISSLIIRLFGIYKKTCLQYDKVLSMLC